MALHGKGSIYQHVNGKMYIYVPASIRDDSQFPLKSGEKVKVSIMEKRLLSRKKNNTYIDNLES